MVLFPFEILLLYISLNKFIFAVGQLDQNDGTTKNAGDIEPKPNLAKKKNCANFEPLTKSNSLTFKSLKDGKWKKLQTDRDDELGRGGFGKVFVALARGGDARGIPEKQCLAVKEIRLGLGIESISHRGFRNAVKVLKKIDKLDETKKRHLLKIYDYGIIGGQRKRSKTNGALIVMEMGTEGFDERLYNEKNSETTEEDDKSQQQQLTLTATRIVALIRQIVEPIREIHQIAMHLDVKPHNFLYVPTVNKNGQGESVEVLKLIDFDGAEPIPKRVGWRIWRRTLAQHKRADYRRRPKNRLTSPLYSSPESRKMLGRCSSKADMWSVGVIIYEIILVRLAKKEHPNASSEILRSAISIQLFHMLAAYSGQRIDLHAKLPITRRFVYDLRWLNAFVDELKSILQIWIKFPRLAVLITNLLNIVPHKRMTADGVLAYLAGECQPAEWASLDYALEGEIFNKISCKKLSEMINGRAQLCADEENSEKCAKKWQKLAQLVDKVVTIRKEMTKDTSEEEVKEWHHQQNTKGGNHYCATTYRDQSGTNGGRGGGDQQQRGLRKQK